MKAAILIAALFAGSAQASENCKFEPIQLFKTDRPKATTPKRAPLVTPMQPTVSKPKRRTKRFDGPRKDGYDWVCDVSPFDPVEFERFERIVAEPAPAADSFVALADLAPEPTSAGVAPDESGESVYAWTPAPTVFYVGYGGSFIPVAPVPEPAAFALLLAGLGAMVVWGKKA